MARRILLALPLLLAACAPGGQSTGGSSPAATTPAAAASVTPASSAAPAQAATGAAEAQAAADALAEDRWLAMYDLLADDAAAPAAQRRLQQADDADVKDAGAAVSADAAALAKAKARRLAFREQAKARLDGLGEAKAAIAAALAKAAATERPGGGTIRVATLDLAGPAGPATVKIVRALDAQGNLVHALVRATAKADGHVAARAETLRADGGATVRFSREQPVAGGATIKSAWSRITLPTGQLGGGGQLALRGADGAARTLIVALKGTEAAPMIVVKDAAAKLEAEITLPVGGDAAATLLRAEAREAIAVKTK